MSSDTPDMTDDPADLGLEGDDEPEPLGKTEGVYQRDADGELTPLPPETIDINGEPRQVRYYPVPMGEFDAYQRMGDDVDAEDLAEILSEKVHTPDRTPQEWVDTEPMQFMAVLTNLIKKGTGQEPESEFHAEVREELEKRHDAGN